MKYEICESCLEFGLDEVNGDLNREEVASLLLHMGADLPDHECERVENDHSTLTCACAGHALR